MMATYFHGGSEIQAAGGGDNLQTLYLLNPNYIAAYSEAAHNQTPPNNMFLLNPSTGAGHHALGHASSQQQQLIGIPLSGTHSDNPGRPSASSTSLQPRDPSHHQIPAPLHGLAVSRVHYNLWNPTVDPSPTQSSPIPTAADVDDQMGFRRPHQGLSLSLSNPAGSAATAVGGGGDDGRMSVTVAAGGSSSVSNGVQGVIQGSKYLKAAQELLDEVVNVGGFDNKGGSNGESSRAHKEKEKAAAVEAATGEGSSGGGGGGGDSGSGSKRPAEQLTTAQRQELQMKKAKLLNMLDEVEQRYRQYQRQMEVIVTTFEQASSTGSAKTYTSLALETISRQFRCLKDAIASQIKATNKSLGEEDNNGGAAGKLEGGTGSRLRFVDHQLRQQRALQQLGMMQHNAWRPQRGLPERAVSVLRAWLFEHFLHPYPKDSDKHMLAKQTGLTRSQVSNWFINARVRLWKPMVEEMYTEEMKSQEHNGVNSEDNKTNTTITAANNNATTPTKNNDRNKDHQSTTRTTTTPQQLIEQHDHSGGATIIHHHNHADHHTATNDMISAMSATSSQVFTLIGSSSDMESLMAARSPKKQRSTGSDMHNSPSSILSMDMDMKHDHHHHHHNQDQRHTPMISNGPGPGFNPYIVNDIGRFNPDPIGAHGHYHGNGVSLTLGLPHHDQQNFINVPSQGMHLGRRLDIGAAEDEFAATNGYDTIDIQSRTRFAAHFLHDFVA